MAVFSTPQPNGYGFGPSGRAYGTPLRLWNPAWMGMFGGPPLPSSTDAAGQALYVELTSGTLSTYPPGAVLTALQNRPAGMLAAKGMDYSIGGVEWLVNPDDGNANFPPANFMYPTATPPGAGLRNNAAFQTGAAVPPNQASWIPRVDVPAYWNVLGAYYTSVLTGVSNSGLYTNGGFAQGILPDVMGTYPAQSFSNLNGDPQPWNFDTNATGMYSANRWLDFMVAGIGIVRGILGGSDNFGCNGLHDGIKYFDPAASTARLLAASDYAMAEEWIRGSGANASPTAFSMTEANWQKNVDMLYDAAVTYGTPVLVCSKLWPNAGAATIAQSKQWFNFLLASFLLGNANNASCGRHWWHYRHDNPAVTYVAGTDGDGSGDDMKGRHNWRPDVNFFGSGNNWFDMVNCLGRNVTHVNYPTQGVASLKFADTYVAHFENGYVLVNPNTTNASASRLTLPALPGGQQWKSVDGTVYSGAVPALAARTGLVITNPTAVSTIEVWDSPTATWDSSTVGWDGYPVDPTHKHAVGAITGTGTLTATGGRIGHHARGAITGQGILSATGTIGTRISAAIVGRGTLTATAHVRTRAKGAIVGTGILTGRATIGGLAPPTGDRQFRIGKRTGGSRLGGLDRIGGRIGHLVTAVQFHIGGAAASRIGGADRIGGLSTFVTDTLHAQGSITGTGTLAATAHVTHHAIGSITGTGTLSATGKRKVHARGAISGTGTLSATGRRHHKVKGALVGTGTLAATALRKLNARGAVVGIGTLRARGQIGGRVSADLLGQGILSGTAHRRIHAVGHITGTGTLSAKSTLNHARGHIIGTGTLTATAHQTFFAHGEIVGIGILTANGTVIVMGHGADFGPTRVLIGVGAGYNRADLLGDHDDP